MPWACLGDGGEVGGGEAGAGGVDPDPGGVVEQCFGHHGAGAVFGVGRHGVFEVEDDGVGAGVENLA